jgi:chromate transporter
LFGAGGGIVLAQRCAVERRRWLSEAEFGDVLTLCEFMPGPNIVGIAICVGAKTRGLAGALAAFVGFALIPATLGFIIALFLLGHARAPTARHVLGAVSAAAAGLMIATGLRLLRRYRGDARAMMIATAAFAALAVVKLPLLLVLAALAPLSIAATMIGRSRAA